MAAPTRDDVAKDTPAVAAYLRALVPVMGGATLAEVADALEHAAGNEAAMALVAHALGAGGEPREGRLRRA